MYGLNLEFKTLQGKMYNSPPLSYNFNPFEAREGVDLSNSNFTKIILSIYQTKFRAHDITLMKFINKDHPNVHICYYFIDQLL
jgi:hypothetical protein